MSSNMGQKTNTSTESRRGAAGYTAIGMPANKPCEICKKDHRGKPSPKCSRARQVYYVEQKAKAAEMGWK